MMLSNKRTISKLGRIGKLKTTAFQTDSTDNLHAIIFEAPGCAHTHTSINHPQLRDHDHNTISTVGSACAAGMALDSGCRACVNTKRHTAIMQGTMS